MFWGKFAGAAGTEYHRLGSFKPQKHIVSQSWRPEVHDPGVSRVGSSLMAMREGLLQASLLGLERLSALCLRVVFPPYVFVRSWATVSEKILLKGQFKQHKF